jgi:arsenate reductase (thioredoxin)
VTSCIFVCIHNSARSQMAEAFINARCDRARAESAGIDGGRLNPLVVAAMAEVGIDISRNRTKTVAEMIAAGRRYDYVITVCDETSAERCPVFPGRSQRLHWGFPDPSALTGSDAEKLAAIRPIRDAIAARCVAWCATLPA